ncbi:MAG: Prophage endopeptidase tail [Bacteriophage sp.]|nr:MAG: Prophage endopeptidase tail [Bacteriophage sp.]UWG05970.1 MAG: Prophage endopeptidase tail [Bacteriophage sp.]
MKIHFNNKEIDILVDTSSYRYTALQNVGTLYLYFASEEFINIPVGAYCIYKNITYYLMDPDDFKKKSSRNFEYTLVMYDIGAILGKYKCRDIVSKRLKFDYTAKPHEHLQLIVDNLNMRDSGWKVGECIEAEEKTINYNHIFCSEALPTIADTFKTEYEIDPAIKTIHLRKVEYNKGEPLPLEYGKDKGFVPGLGRSNKDGNRPVTILYVQGGEQNIDFSKYGSKELLLPKNQRLEYEGRAYVSDAEGLYIKRADTTLTDVQEDSLDCSHISPKRVGSVSNVVVSDKEKNFYDFIDSSIPDDLNFEDYVIEGNNMTVIFQSGMLAGSNKEFEVKYVHKERKFLITPQEIDGQIMPNDIYKPNLGDKYAVFGIQLPDAYICNNSTKEGASWDMFREAAKYLYENEDPKFTFKGELDSIYSKKRWLSIGGKIKLGGYILFKDPQFIPEGIKIRITSIKEYIHRPYSPIIELSNTTTGVTVSSELNKIESNEVKTDNQYKNSIQFTKRRFRDAKETISMLNDALLHFSGSISPISVQTMSLLVGDESLQFRFVNNKTNPTQVEYLVTYDSKKKVLSAPGGILQHMTIGIDTLSSGHKASEYKFWDIEKYTSPTLTETVGYYLYVKANKNGTTGSYVLSKNAIKLEGVEGYYHFLVGILNSEFEEDRSFVELFGFTEILPGRITTDRIVSSDGLNFMDFVNNAFRVGNSDSYFDWNTKGDKKLRLKGTIVQSESGDESPIGCFRGVYDNSYTYYWGDEVIYDDGTGYSMYRFVSKNPVKGISPNNSNYWIIVAQRGVGISNTDVLYAISSSNTIAPTSGWQTTAPAWKDGYYIWSKTKVVYTDGDIVYTDAACITGGKGETGNGISSIIEQYYLSSSATSLLNGSWSNSRPTWKNGWYIWTRSVINYTNGNSITTEAICVTGEKGETGDDGINGDYFEYRYAVNGSRSTPPSLSKTSRNPSGWSTTVPTVGNLQYLWFTVAKINGETNSLIQNWSTPARQTPYDGVDGRNGDIGPTMVYRGVYGSSKVYYGTSKRVDAVKYNGHYYVARVDAGNGFQNHVPTDTAYWNDFGAEFESIATNLLLAEGANIGDWFMSGGKIVSTLLDGNKIILDASMARILIESSRSGGDYSESQYQGSKITIDANNGLIEARSKSNRRVAYMSPTGIFCNNAETQAVSAILGYTHKASIVGLGFGTVNKSDWNNENFLAGVYGRASNSGTAPAYGGFFQNLMAAGLFLHRKAIEESSSSVYLSETDSLVIGYSRNQQIVYLPSDGVIGRTIFFKQWWTGYMRVYPRSGNVLYDDHTQNDYYDIGEGQGAIFHFTVGYVDGVKKSAWLISRYKF